MRNHDTECEPIVPAAYLYPPKPSVKPTLELMKKYINKWVYMWSVFGYNGWFYVLDVGMQKYGSDNKLVPVALGCHPGIRDKFYIYLGLIDNLAVL